jgi:non-heme chloroperoxidase
VLSAEFLALLPGLFSSDVGEGVRGLESLLHLCFTREPEAPDRYTMLGFGVSVPPSVRQALLTRVLDNDDLLPTIVKPVLITHGALDAVVRQEVVAQHRAGLPHAQVDIMADAGHAAFWDDAAQFNRRLGAFREEVARTGASYVAAGGAA